MTTWERVPARTKEVFEYLTQCALDMRTVAYGEVAHAVGLDPRGIGQPLGYIRDVICRERGLPWLNAIGVRQDTRRPGDSFLPEGVAMGKDEEHMWRGMVLQVFCYDWTNVEFDY